MRKDITTDSKDQLPQRHLTWPHCYNTRDLGALPTAGGKTTRWRALIRSDILTRLNQEGQQALLDYGVRTIIDLRSPREAEEEPLAFVNDVPALTYLNQPLEKYYPHVSDLISQAQSRGEVYCIVLDHYPDAVAAVMRAVIESPPGGIVIHCHAGKDRTGIVAALLLRLAGVPPEIVAADYAESQLRLWPLYEQIVAQAGDADPVDFWLQPTATVDMMYMMLDHLETRYGGVAHYLQAAGLTSHEIDQLKGRLCPA